MFHLDDLETTVTRTRRPLIAAAALVSAVIALLGSELAMPLIEHLSAYGLAIVTMIEATVAALLGGFVVHHGLRRERNAGHVVGFAAMAGFVYPIILVMIPLICLAPFSDDTQMLAFSLFVCFIVSAFSAAIGCLFGVVFCVGTVIGARALATPSHQSPAIAWLASARMLLVGATLVVLALAPLLESSYREIFLAFGIEAPLGTDIAWTRFFVLPTPLLLVALLFALRGVSLARRLEQTARMLTAGTHPVWILDEPHTEEVTALPLRECDRHGTKVIRMRREGVPYRVTAPAIARMVGAGELIGSAHLKADNEQPHAASSSGSARAWCARANVDWRG